MKNKSNPETTDSCADELLEVGKILLYTDICKCDSCNTFLKEAETHMSEESRNLAITWARLLKRHPGTVLRGLLEEWTEEQVVNAIAEVAA
jgi:hypothetical protein